MPLDQDKLAHVIHSASLKKIDVEVTSATTGLSPRYATQLLQALNIDGKAIKGIKSELNCNRETAARTIFARLTK